MRPCTIASLILAALFSLSGCSSGTTGTPSMEIGGLPQDGTPGDEQAADTSVGPDAVDRGDGAGADVPEPDGTCVPVCGNHHCGPDGCGGKCGQCDVGFLCREGQCLSPETCFGPEDCAPYVCGEDDECTPCVSDEQCDPLGMLCNVEEGTCQDCLDDEDCSPLHQCLQGVCVAAPPCQSDDDCGEDEICVPDSGVCKKCVPDCDGKECGGDGCSGSCGGCGEGHVCVDGQCKVAPGCAFPGECFPLVCDTVAGKCVACTSDSQCPPLTVCDEVSGMCVECSTHGDCPDLNECVDNVCMPLPPCLDDGDCEEGEICQPGTGVCVLCPPACEGKQCGADGCGGVCGLCKPDEECLGFQCQPVLTCSAEECHPLVCNQETGECAPCDSDEQCPGPGGICHPEEGECVECVADGDCGDGDVCDDGVCQPIPPCLSDEDCLPGQKCDVLIGLCLGCTPSCIGKECGTDGCQGSCGECQPGSSCQQGLCVCQPDCLGKSCGSDGCGGLCGDCGDAGQCVAGQCILGWSDPGSGLIWQNPSAPGTYTQYGGEEYCNNLVWGGSDQWYLPSIDQLWTIAADGSGCHWKAGLQGPCGEYWSSTFHAGSNDDWEALDFTDLDVDGEDNDGLKYVRCVRNGP